jgi:hypothetical protein
VIEDGATIVGILVKYGVILFAISFAVAIASSLIRKLRDEPGTLFKVVFVTLTPFVLAIGLPYFVLYEQFHLPFLLNVVVGFVIYAVAHGFLEKRVDVRFKDEV